MGRTKRLTRKKTRSKHSLALSLSLYADVLNMLEMYMYIGLSHYKQFCRSTLEYTILIF